MYSKNAQPPQRLRGLPSWLLGQGAMYSARLVTDVLDRIGLRRYHYALLSALEEFGPSSQAELGRHCGIDRSDMVKAVNEMVGWGLVERAVDPANPRRNIITLTIEGQSRLNTVGQALQGSQDQLLTPLSAAEREQLVHLLGRVVDYHRDGA